MPPHNFLYLNYKHLGFPDDKVKIVLQMEDILYRYCISFSVFSSMLQLLYLSIKGTWQRGGFSGVFAEIGSA
jgi:hypothetical protein